ncbi:hypothetical protein INR49_013474 [Caranx melampygus]|nr:hypothetical protein INR49_013474 [Caranx melampygus]
MSDFYSVQLGIRKQASRHYIAGSLQRIQRRRAETVWYVDCPLVPSLPLHTELSTHSVSSPSFLLALLERITPPSASACGPETGRCSPAPCPLSPLPVPYLQQRVVTTVDILG